MIDPLYWRPNLKLHHGGLDHSGVYGGKGPSDQPKGSPVVGMHFALISDVDNLRALFFELLTNGVYEVPSYAKGAIQFAPKLNSGDTQHVGRPCSGSSATPRPITYSRSRGPKTRSTSACPLRFQ